MIPYGRKEITDEDVAAVQAVLFSADYAKTLSLNSKRLLPRKSVPGSGLRSIRPRRPFILPVLRPMWGQVIWFGHRPSVLSHLPIVPSIAVRTSTLSTLIQSASTCACRASKRSFCRRSGKAVCQSCHTGPHVRSVMRHGCCGAVGGTLRFSGFEDASHAIGERYLDQPVGSCAYSDVVVFSFHPVKIITTGEGGMAVTNGSELADRMACSAAMG